jgi:hypothetical protein
VTQSLLRVVASLRSMSDSESAPCRGKSSEYERLRVCSVSSWHKVCRNFERLRVCSRPPTPKSGEGRTKEGVVGCCLTVALFSSNVFSQNHQSRHHASDFASRPPDVNVGFDLTVRRSENDSDHRRCPASRLFFCGDSCKIHVALFG